MKKRNSSKRGKWAKWTEAENQLTLRHIRAFPQNLHKCFMIIAEETGRTPQGVQAHWYSSLSKRPDVMCFFTASPHHVARNRKNGMGVESNGNIWRRLMAIIRNIC